MNENEILWHVKESVSCSVKAGFWHEYFARHVRRKSFQAHPENRAKHRLFNTKAMLANAND
jgi:hypothetical protein